jgi:hypothetical protein
MAVSNIKAPNFYRIGPNPSGADCTRVIALTNPVLGATILDSVILARVKRGVKFVWAFMQSSAFDSNGSPLLTVDLQITDGTTTKYLIKGSTTVRSGGLAIPSQIPATENGLNYVTPSNSFYLQVVATAAAATFVATGTLIVGFTTTGHYETGELTQ